MVWTQIESNFFFLDATQIGLSIPVQAYLQLKVIIEVDDLLEFDDDQWKTVVSNLKNPESTMGVAWPKSPPVPIRGISYAIGENSLSLLKVASEAVRYHDSIGRTTVPVNMAWTTLSYFDFQWKALLSIKASQSDSAIPRLTKNLKVMKWAPTIIAFWTTYIGAINLPLTYLSERILKSLSPLRHWK